jgi:hypothetical protein
MTALVNALDAVALFISVCVAKFQQHEEYCHLTKYACSDYHDILNKVLKALFYIHAKNYVNPAAQCKFFKTIFK